MERVPHAREAFSISSCVIVDVVKLSWVPNLTTQRLPIKCSEALNACKFQSIMSFYRISLNNMVKKRPLPLLHVIIFTHHSILWTLLISLFCHYHVHNHLVRTRCVVLHCHKSLDSRATILLFQFSM